MKTTTEQAYLDKMIENVKMASRWLTENVDLTTDYHYLANGLNILANSSPVRIVVTDSCAVLNGKFTRKPYTWNCGEDAYDLTDGFPKGAEGSLVNCGMLIARHWESIKADVAEHNKNINKAMTFKI